MDLTRPKKKSVRLEAWVKKMLDHPKCVSKQGLVQISLYH